VLRCLRTDRVTVGITRYVISIMGERYVQPPTLDYASIYKQSTETTPIVFVLSPGKQKGLTPGNLQERGCVGAIGVGCSPGVPAGICRTSTVRQFLGNTQLCLPVSLSMCCINCLNLPLCPHPGADPAFDVFKLGEEMGFKPGAKLKYMALGQVGGGGGGGGKSATGSACHSLVTAV
jgi:hypothetical protein